MKNASDVLAVTPDDLAHAAVAGCVGEGPAAEFAAFRQLYRELPDVDAALTAPDATPVPREPAAHRLYAPSTGSSARPTATAAARCLARQGVACSASIDVFTVEQRKDRRRRRDRTQPLRGGTVPLTEVLSAWPTCRSLLPEA